MHAHVDSLNLLLSMIHFGFYLVAAVAAIFLGALVASKLSPSDPSLDISAWDPVPCTRRPESAAYTLTQIRLAEIRAARRAATDGVPTRPLGLLPHPDDTVPAPARACAGESQSLGDWLWDVSTPVSATEDADNRPPPTPRRPDTLLCEGIVAGGEIPLNLLDWNGQPL
jgi:hypothetical protein